MFNPVRSCVTYVGMPKKMGVIDFVSEIKREENYPDFEQSPQVIQHGLQGFMAKNMSKMSLRRQIILVIFCRRGSVA